MADDALSSRDIVSEPTTDTGNEASTMAQRDEIAQRIVRFLVIHRKHDQYECHLSMLGFLAPQQAGAPRVSLKKLCISRPDLFLVTTEADGTCLVRLRCPNAAACAPCAAAETGAVAPTAADPHPSNSKKTPYKDDYDVLELQLIAHLIRLPSCRTSLPSLGEYCQAKLGVNMKHRLIKFIDARPEAFARDYDGRQQVWCVLERNEDVEAYVRKRFGNLGERNELLPGMDALREGLELRVETVDAQIQANGPSVKIPDSLGPEFWGSEDFPAL